MTDGTRSFQDWRPFIVIGAQRTGTTLLREILNSNDKVAMVAEILLPYPDTCHWNHFVEYAPQAGAPPRDEAAGLELLDTYFIYLRNQVAIRWKDPKRYGATAIGVDIKYDQLHLIEPVGWPETAPPFLLHYACKRNILMINTVRRNVLQCAISYLIGLQRQFWHNYEGRRFDRAYELNIHECLYLARDIVRYQAEFERCTKGAQFVTCHYEDLVQTTQAAGPGGCLPNTPSPLRDISSALNIPYQFTFDGKLQRAINSPYRDIISNYDKLLAAVGNSEFAPFVGALL